MSTRSSSTKRPVPEAIALQLLTWIRTRPAARLPAGLAEAGGAERLTGVAGAAVGEVLGAEPEPLAAAEADAVAAGAEDAGAGEVA